MLGVSAKSSRRLTPNLVVMARSQKTLSLDPNVARAVEELEEEGEYSSESEAMSELAGNGLQLRELHDDALDGWLPYLAIAAAVIALLSVVAALLVDSVLVANVALFATAVTVVVLLATTVRLWTAMQVLNGGL